jgi:hypothetical protein
MRGSDDTSRVKTWLWPVVIAMILVAIAVSTGTWYETTDDAIMNAFSAGQLLSSHPDEHLVFTSVLIGFPLKLAYTIAPGINWYGVYLVVTLALTAAAFLWIFSDLSGSWLGRALVIGFLIATVSTAFARLQFTRVAFLAAEAGCLLVWRSLDRGLSENRASAVVGGALVLFATWVRAEIALMAALFSGPLFVPIVWKGLFGGRSPLRRQAFRAMGIVIAACFLSVALDSAYYRADESWGRFVTYQSRRLMFMDGGRVGERSVPDSVLEAAGWSRNDLSMMTNWFGLHPTVYDLQKQDYIISQAAQPLAIFDSQVLSEGLKQYKYDKVLWLLFAIVAIALVLAHDRNSALTIVGSTAAITAVLLILLINWYVPPRVAQPGISVAAATGLCMFGRRVARGQLVPSKWMTAMGCIVVLVFAKVSVQATWLMSEDAAGTHRMFAEQVRRLNPAPTDLYVIWGGEMQLEQLVTPLGGFSDTSGLQALQLGWPNRSPHTDRRLYEFGMSDLYVDLWRKPNAFLISSQSRCLGLVQFVAAHYGPIITCTTTDPVLSVRRVSLSTTQPAGPSINVRGNRRRARGAGPEVRPRASTIARRAHLAVRSRESDTFAPAWSGRRPRRRRHRGHRPADRCHHQPCPGLVNAPHRNTLAATRDRHRHGKTTAW